jgi:hypothetical protein
LGAPKEAIQKAYDANRPLLQPAIHPVEVITERNFQDHLGDKKYVLFLYTLLPGFVNKCSFRYYSAYFDFYKQVVHEKGVVKTLEEDIFSTEANLRSDGSKPLMLSRFLADIIHPLIHIGYGVDLDVDGIVVEGKHNVDGNFHNDYN